MKHQSFDAVTELQAENRINKEEEYSPRTAVYDVE